MSTTQASTFVTQEIIPCLVLTNGSEMLKAL